MSKRKLLLADDSITIQKVVNLTFADEGIEVFTVGDGDSAMEKLREFSPDLIMADVNMPGLNGYQICESIKQDEFQKHIPVILLVGSFEPFDEEEAKRVGADDFLTKPFQSIRQLVNKVTELLNSNNGKSSESHVSSFAETLELPKESEIIKTEFDNNEFDDEMIQTNQVGNFAFDEVQKFEAKDVDVSEEPDYGKTQPLSVEEVKEFAFSPSENLAEKNADEAVLQQDSETISDTEEVSDSEKDYSFSDTEEDVTSENESINAETEERFEQSDEEDVSENESDEEVPNPIEADKNNDDLPYPSSATILDLNDDFLELPPIEGEEEDEEIVEDTPSQNPISEPIEQEQITEESEEPKEFEESENSEESEEINVEEPITPTVPTSLNEFSPELIEAIAQRVIEKLSDQVIREIAWEVVPQQADLIIKKMVEEKLKE